MAELPDSQESFSEFWKSNFGYNTDLFPDLGTVSVEACDPIPTEHQDNTVNSGELPDCPPKLHVHSNENTNNISVHEDSKSKCDSSCSISECDIPGEYGFMLGFVENTQKVTKSARFTYSPELKKLFVQMGENCPIQFKCATHPPPGCVIRAMPLFKKLEDANDVVKTCLNHSKFYCDSICSDHLIVVDKSKREAIYGLTTDGHRNVCVSYEIPQVGMEYFVVCYKFSCLSSCKSGINRRPAKLVFYLETSDGNVIGQCSVDFCVCTCPGRDRIREEWKQKKNLGRKRKHPHSFPGVQNIKENEGDSDDDNQLYTIEVQGRKLYEMFLTIRDTFYEQRSSSCCISKH